MALSIERQLPEELLDRVVSMCSGDALKDLCLTSKQLNRIGTPHLYSHIVLGAPACDEGETHISQLAYLLLNSKSHAALVTSISVTSSWGSEREQGKKEKVVWPVQTREMDIFLNDHLSRFALGDMDRNEVFEKLKSGSNEDAILALLLFCLPNLQRLDMNFGYCEQHEDFVSIFELLADNIRLQSNDSAPRMDIMVKGEDNKYPNLPVHLAALLHMPFLRSIYGWKMGDHEGDFEGDPDPDFARLKPHLSSVEYIELRSSKLQKDNLGRLMAATTPGKLKTFNYEIGDMWAWCDSPHPAIMTSLQAHCKTLESLGLSHEAFYLHQFGNDHEETYSYDFKMFTALKRLKVAPCYIWGHAGYTKESELWRPSTKEMLWMKLPPSLEQLWICRAESQMPRWNGINDGKLHFEYDCLLPALNLVLQHKNNYPTLNNIRIEFSGLTWPTNATFATLAAFCESAECSGIHCTIILTDMAVPNANTASLLEERRWGWDEDVEWGECLWSERAGKIWIDAAAVSDLAQEIRNAVDKYVTAHQKT